MKIDFEDHDAATVVSLVGALTGDQIDGFRRAIDERFERGMRDVVLDVDRLHTADSAGLEALLWLDEETASRFGSLRIAGANETLRSVLTVTRLESRFQLHDDVQSAGRSLR